MSIEFIDLKAQQSRIRTEIDKAIDQVLAHGRYIMGPEVTELEEKLSAFSGARHSLTCSSGTDALLIIMMAHDIGAGDAVFVPSFTYTATAEVVSLLGAQPVFVDVDPGTFNIDISNLEEAISDVAARDALKPRAVLAVDLFGQPANYDLLQSLCELHELVLISDAAQSFGAILNNRRVGSLAPITATSFFPAKPLGCYGDGGAIFTDDDELADTMRSIRTHGAGRAKYDIERIGINGRLDTLQAAILLAKLKIFEDECQKKDFLAQRYSDALRAYVDVPLIGPNRTSVWAQYVIRVPDGARVGLQQRLKEAGCPSMIYYPAPMHLQKAYAQWGRGLGSLPVSERLCDEVLALPMHAYLTDEAFETITGTVAQWANGART